MKTEKGFYAARKDHMSATEIITMAECLKRIGLEDLVSADSWSQHNTFVEWNGYPRPFPCGHTDTYGFGPLRKDYGFPEATENDSKGSGRLYQDRVRVNQYHCSGEVLFSFPCWSHDKAFRLNHSMVISIDTIPDCKSTCLKVCFTA